MKKTVTLKGHSVKYSSKSKNRVWTSSDAKNTPHNSQLSHSSLFCGVLTSCKTKIRPRQWMANRHLQLAQQSLRKAALLSSAKKASLVSLQQGRYMLDSSGKRLKKVDSSEIIPAPSCTIKYRINMEASVKRVRAKYVSLCRIIATLYWTLHYSHVVEKSKRYAWYARSKNREKKKQYCIFFNRFGQ